MCKDCSSSKREEGQQNAMEGLQNGSVDFIATDHAPYELEAEKLKKV